MPRQREALRLVAHGLADGEIARLMGLTEHTVTVYLHGAYTRLGCHERTTAAIRLLDDESPGWRATTSAGRGRGEGGRVEIRVEGGMLDGQTVTKDDAAETIHQTGITLLRYHEPYPRRKGEKISERLLTYTEDYALTMTEDGPVYRCVAPFGGVTLGDERLVASEGGAFDVWKWADGKWHARPH